MPKNIVSDPITDLEMAFARLVLFGGMTDRQAAEAVGLNPDSAAYTKSKPRVREYMLEQRAAVQQQLVQQEAGRQHRFILDREQVLERLWELAKMSPEITRGSMTGQVKALSMIVAMENLIPDRRAVSAQEKSAFAAARPQIHAAPWVGEQQATTPTPMIDPEPSPALAEAEDSSGVPEPGLPPGLAEHAPVDPGPSQFTSANRVSPAKAPPPSPYVPLFTSVPDLGIPFPIKNPFVRR